MIDKEIRDYMRFIVKRLGDAASENNSALVMFHAGQLVALVGRIGILEEPPETGLHIAATDSSLFLGDSQ